MTNPADSSVQNLLPVQAYFNAQGQFQTFIGQGQPFTATISPNQSGLNITNSTINSSIIGGTTPAAGYFTSGTVATAPTGATDIANKQYVDYYAAGLSWKQPVATATSANITRSGLQTINGVTLVAGDRVLVKDQGTASENGIYTASATAWAYAVGADDWAEYVGAIVFVSSGSLNGTAWYCTAQPGGTLGVTAMNWSNFSVASSYTAGTGLTLTGTQFSITNTGLAAATYGSASSIPVIAFNAQGQATSVTNTTVTPAVGSITGLGTGVATWLATPSSANLASAVSDETGSGSLVFATSPTLVTPILGTPTSGNFSTGTFTWPTFNQNTTGTASKATNIVGGAAGSVPYQTATDTTGFLAAGTNGQVLTLASGVPSWATPTTGTVTSVGGTGTVNGLTLTGTVTTTGNLTLGGTLNLSAPPTIGNTTPNSGAFTTLSASTSLTTPTVQATNSAGLSLKNSAGTTQMSMGAGGGDNLAINVSTNLNGTNAQIDISPTGTGHVHINPSGSGSIEMNPTAAGTMNNMVIGGTTPLAGTFTTLRINSTISLAGSTGTNGYVLTSAGASAPTWSALPASGITVTDDTTTNATRYLAFTSATSGTITGQNVSSTKLQYNPSTGALSSTSFSGSGANLTDIAGIITWQSVQTSNFTAVAGRGYPVNTTSSALTVTFPASPSAGNIITLTDYAGTWDTKNVTINPNGNKLIGGTINLLLQNQRESVSFVYIDATQGWLPYSGFQDAIPASTSYTASYLVVAGGGGGASSGAGAGGYQTSTATLNAGTTYTITVGGGGGTLSNGSDSVISGSGLTTITSVGGGSGIGAGSNGSNGGSGGGGGASGSGTTVGGSGTVGQGNAGGGNVGFVSNPFPSGGGGGAGATGGNAVNSTTSGDGGTGTASSITGSSVTYAGGGGGATYISGNTAGAGGAGGGGGGGSSGNGTAGTANTGGGGGGAYVSGSGGAGGSGVVILSVPTTRYSGTTTGSPTVTTSGSNTILTYNSSGSYTG
jgi:hypothetical protein